MDCTLFVIYALDLIGTSAFAFSGALRALDRRPDFVGISILAGVTAIGGGMMRDAILGRQAAVLTHPAYMYVILGSVLVLYLFPRSFWKRGNWFKYFDAFGYGVFAGVAANIGVKLDMNLFSVMTLAVITGCGGGVIRDVIIQKPSLPLSDELYVIPVLLGSIALFCVNRYQWGAGLPMDVELIGFLTATILTTGLRIVAIRCHWRLPRVWYSALTKD